MIPLATTSLTIKRSAITVEDDPYDSPSPGDDYSIVAVNVRAVISTPSASNDLAGGDRIVYNARLTCDPCDLKANDEVIEGDGTQWLCLWVRPQIALGVDHFVAALRYVTGAT